MLVYAGGYIAGQALDCRYAHLNGHRSQTLYWSTIGIVFCGRPTFVKPWRMSYAPMLLSHLTGLVLQKPPCTNGRHPFTRKAVVQLSRTLTTFHAPHNLTNHLHHAWWHKPPHRGQTELANTKLCQPYTSTKRRPVDCVCTWTYYRRYDSCTVMGQNLSSTMSRLGRLVDVSCPCELSVITHYGYANNPSLQLSP